MRDLFEDLFAGAPVDPMESARQGMRPALKRRFYARVDVAPAPEGGFSVALDQRPIRTPARGFLLLPTQALAAAVAAEWEAQREVVDPARMPLTRLANTTIDGVIQARADVAAEVAKYLGSDLLFYRAAGPAGLVTRQNAAWDPLLAWAREARGARFILAEGVVFVAQPEAALAAMRAAIPTDPWRLAAVHTVTTLTGSALIALALAAEAVTVEAAWTAAHVDEDWNMEQWGQDPVAMARREGRAAEMQAAAAVLNLVR